MLKPEMDQYFNMDARAKVLINWGYGIQIAGFILGSIELITGMSISSNMYGKGRGIPFLIALLVAMITVGSCVLARHVLVAYATITQNTLNCVDILRSYNHPENSNTVARQKKQQPSVQEATHEEPAITGTELKITDNIDTIRQQEYHSDVYFPESRWLCPSCGNENEPFCNVCSKCGSIIKEAPPSNS